MRRRAGGRALAIALPLAALLMSGAPVGAQMSPGARSVGMGGGGLVFAAGVDAVEWNPANLGRNRGWNVSIFEAGTGTAASGASLNGLFSLFDAALPGSATEDPSAVIAAIPEEGVRVTSVSEGFAFAFAADASGLPRAGQPLPTVGVAVGPVGLRVRGRVMSELTLTREVADLIGMGFDTNRIEDYSVGQTGWGSTWVTEFTASYGTMVGDLLSVGVGARYVLGHGMVQGRFSEPEVDLVDRSLSLESVVVESPGGHGFGIDLGASLDLPAGFRLSASGSNLLSRMSWDEHLVAHSADFTEEDFTQGRDYSELVELFESRPVEPTTASLAVYQASEGLFDQNFYPQILRGGLGWRSGGTSVEVVGIRVSPRGRMTSAWDQRMSFGVEQKVPVFTLRAGYAIGREGSRTVTGGLGLGVGPVLLEGSAGVFTGDTSVLQRQDFYATLALQLRGGER